MILYDDGGGITRRSIDFWHDNKHKIGNVGMLKVSFDSHIHNDKEYNLVAMGNEGTIFLSGCNCGYGGEGPHGTKQILIELGVPADKAEEYIYKKNLVFFWNIPQEAK
jgi:hypothetical protein